MQSLLKSTILQYNVRGWRKLCDRLFPQPRISFVPSEAGKSPVNRTKAGEGLDPAECGYEVLLILVETDGLKEGN